MNLLIFYFLFDFLFWILNFSLFNGCFRDLLMGIIYLEFLFYFLLLGIIFGVLDYWVIESKIGKCGEKYFCFWLKILYFVF